MSANIIKITASYHSLWRVKSSTEFKQIQRNQSITGTIWEQCFKSQLALRGNKGTSMISKVKGKT